MFVATCSMNVLHIERAKSLSFKIALINALFNVTWLHALFVENIIPRYNIDIASRFVYI